MIRVLHVVHTMECGGIETMLMNIYRKIDRTRIQFDFLVNGSDKSYYSAEILALGGRIYSVTPKRVSLRENMKETYEVIRDGGYRIVHIHQDSMIGFAICCAKKAGVKMIIAHAHTTSANGWYRKLTAMAARRYIARNADVRFACSDAAARWIFGKKEDDITIIKNAVDAARFRYDAAKSLENRKKLGIGREQFVVGTCGRLSVEKNQSYLLDIFYELKKRREDSVLIIVGDGEERQRLQEKAVKLGIAEAVMFPGMVNNAEMYYSVMDCFVLPSMFEGLPLAGIEAQAAGIPAFFSMGITREIGIIPAVFFEDISREPKVWADRIMKECGQKIDTYQLIRQAGYDTGENVRLLQDVYLSV